MTAQQLFEQLGYIKTENEAFIQYKFEQTWDQELKVIKRIYLTFDKLKGYYYFEGVDSGKAAIPKINAGLHYAITKQLKELGWIE
jgi:hypothetical protein